MPGDYFSGDVATPDDVARISRYLSGTERLPSDLAAKADLNRDGKIDSTDLLLISRLVSGNLSAPLPPPHLELIEPSFARPGGGVSLTGTAISTAQGSTKIAFSLASESFLLDPSSVIQNQVTFVIPTRNFNSHSAIIAEVRVIIDGVPSNAVPLIIISGPLVRSIEAADGNLLRLHGAGFGNDISHVEVTADETSYPVTFVADEMIVISAASGFDHPASFIVFVDGVASPPLLYRPLRTIEARVVLPLGSPLSFGSLSVTSTGGAVANIGAAGQFQLEVTAGKQTLIDIITADQHPTLTALVRSSGAAPAQIDADSTASSLVFQFAGGALLEPSKQSSLINQLQVLPEVVDLGRAIAAGHAAAPFLKDLFASNMVVRSAFQNGIAKASVIVQTLG